MFNDTVHVVALDMMTGFDSTDLMIRNYSSTENHMFNFNHIGLEYLLQLAT